MGGMWFRTREFGGALSEKAGYKSGLALDEERLRGFLNEGGYESLWPTDDVVMRIRSEEFEELFAYVLCRLGIGPQRFEPSPMVAVWHRVKDDPVKSSLFEQVGAAFVTFLQSEAQSPSGDPIDPRPFIKDVEVRHGAEGALMAIELLRSAAGYMARSPWSPLTVVRWENVRDLDDLFTSEKLDGPHGQYFDQRFDELPRGELRTGRQDQLASVRGARRGVLQAKGVRDRAWPRPRGWRCRHPPLARRGGRQSWLLAAVLVQCKRTQAKVSNTVAKALWADVVAERADSGLIVTTSSLSPSADAVRTARQYPVAAVERPTLRQWAEAIRVPGSGFFLGE